MDSKGVQEPTTVNLQSWSVTSTSKRPKATGAELAPGVEVGGRYVVKSLLGQGGMGRVWLVEDVEEKCEVAFKEVYSNPDQSLAGSQRQNEMFRREFFA